MSPPQGRHLLAGCLALLLSQPAGAQPPAQGGLVRTDRHGDPLPPGARARLGTLRLRQEALVTALALSPNGALVAAGGGGVRSKLGLAVWQHTPLGQIRIWETATGKELCTLAPDEPGVSCLRFSPDGALLAAVCGGPEVVLWHARTGKLLRRLAQDGANLEAVVFSPDGRFLHAAEDVCQMADAKICRWEVATGKLVRIWREPTGRPFLAPLPGQKPPDRLLALHLSPDGQQLLKVFGKVPDEATARVPRLEVHEAATGKLVRMAALRADVGRFVVSADGKWFACAGEKNVSVGDTALRAPPRDLAGADVGRPLALSADGKHLACWLADGRVGLWHTQTGPRFRECHQARLPWRGPLAFSGNGQTLAVAEGNSVRLWSVGTGRERFALAGHRSPVSRVIFSPDGRTLTSSGDGIFWRWDTATGRDVQRLPRAFPERGETFVGASPDGMRLVTRARGGALRLRWAEDGKVVRDLPADDATNATFAPDGQALFLTRATTEECRVTVHDAATGAPRGRVVLPGFGRAAEYTPSPWRGAGLAVSPDGKFLAWMGEGGRISLVDLPAGKILRTFGTLSAPAGKHVAYASWLLAFAPDGRYLFSSRQTSRWLEDANITARAVCLWSVPAGKEIRRFQVWRADGHLAAISCAAFAPDGRTLALGTYGENSVHLWEIASGQLRRRFDGHLRAVLSLAFAPDGRTLASGSEDSTVLLWDLTDQQ